MPLASCPRCESMFNKQDAIVCAECLPDEEADYEKVREALHGKPEMSTEMLAESAGVEVECILRFLEAGRIETMEANKGVVCGRCGGPAISISKRLCESCLQKLNSELNKQQSQVRLANKKRVDLGGAFRSSGGSITKFQR